MGFLTFCPQAEKSYRTVHKFEKRFAKRVGARHAVAVNSGYSALYLALLAHGIGEGDEVIVPALTMIATANAVKATGAKPVFCDVDDYGLIDVSTVKITKKTKAIMPVHLYGNVANVNEFAKKHNLIVIEDAAEAHGAIKYSKNTVCYSFYSNKIIQTGEGGMVTTNDKKIATKIEKLRSYHFTDQQYVHDGFGFSFRMNPYGARHGLRELKMWKYKIWRRKLTARIYQRLLNIGTLYRGSVCWLYPAIDDDMPEIAQILDIPTRDFFVPLSAQKIYGGNFNHPKAWELYVKGLLLPTIKLNIIKQIYICQKINKIKKMIR